MAQYLESWGKLLQAQATLDGLKVEYERNLAMYRAKAVSHRELNLSRSAAQARQELVDKLKVAVEKLKKRAAGTRDLVRKEDDLTAGLEAAGEEQLKPLFARTVYYSLARGRDLLI